MFNLFNNKQLDEEIDKLENTYKTTIDHLNKQIKDLHQQIANSKNGDVATSSFAIDFNVMRVFAIERNIHNNTVCTIVGHFVAEPVAFTDGNVADKDVTREWYMYCSQQQHEKLVAEFEAYKARGQNG